MATYQSDYLEDEAYDSSTYSQPLRPEFDQVSLAVGTDVGYLAGAEKFPAFWDDAMSASSWSDAGMPDTMVDSGIAPVPEMIGSDFYPERFLPSTTLSEAPHSPKSMASHIIQATYRPHRSATVSTRPTSSPEKSPKHGGVRSLGRHAGARYGQKGFGAKSPSAATSAVVKAKSGTSQPSKSQASRTSSTSSVEGSASGGTKYTRTHYVVEKRYRTNLNDKFEELRDCLATARACLSEDYCPDSHAGREDQLRMSKTRVLGEAVEYIRHLEEQNDRAMDRIEHLEKRMGLRDTEGSISNS
ncbi:hypothetical protein GQ53DRAFT_819960 [Thozetella sp. PMI_491]|nr:hypothetical protein GQ53DRAFT_819960 [Thozetella sp. PMI_491]